MTKFALYRRALQLYRTRKNAEKWLDAVKYLRSRGLWVMDGAKPRWGNHPEKEAA